MDLTVALDGTITSNYGANPTLILILSHGVAEHEAVLCGIVSNLLPTHPLAIQPSGDSSIVTNSEPGGRCLFIALQKTTNIYERLLGGVSQRFSGKNPRLQFIDLSSWLQNTGCEDSVCTIERVAESRHGDEFLQYLSLQVSQFVQQNASHTNDGAIIVFDNITVLMDLGIEVIQLHRLISRLLQLDTNAPSRVRLILGCHVGQSLDDVLSSESEPRFVHWIDLLKSRANCLLELRSLDTGYTVSVDGEMSIREAFSSANTKCKPNQTRTFHYRCDGRRVVCYPPGTSKLVT